MFIILTDDGKSHEFDENQHDNVSFALAGLIESLGYAKEQIGQIQNKKIPLSDRPISTHLRKLFEHGIDYIALSKPAKAILIASHAGFLDSFGYVEYQVVENDEVVASFYSYTAAKAVLDHIKEG